MLPLPLVAVVVGLALRPRRIWLPWLGSVLMVWIVIGYMGKYETPEMKMVASIMIEALAWMFFGVLIPLWFGQLMRAENDERRHPGQPSGT